VILDGLINLNDLPVIRAMPFDLSNTKPVSV